MTRHPPDWSGGEPGLEDFQLFPESSCLANCTAGSAAPLPGARPYSSAETAAELTAFSKENPFFL